MAGKAKAAEPGLDLASAGESVAPAPAPGSTLEPAEPAPSVAPVLDLSGLTVALDALTGRLAAVESRLPQRDQPPSPTPDSLGKRLARWLKEPV